MDVFPGNSDSRERLSSPDVFATGEGFMVALEWVTVATVVYID